MPDHIGGIAILDRRDPAKQHLYAYGMRDGKSATFICIPVFQQGQPKPHDNAWGYVVAGDQLNVTPSVRQTTGNNGPEIFHNAGAWSVQFRDVVADAYVELQQANPGVRDAD